MSIQQLETNEIENMALRELLDIVLSAESFLQLPIKNTAGNYTFILLNGDGSSSLAQLLESGYNGARRSFDANSLGDEDTITLRNLLKSYIEGRKLQEKTLILGGQEIKITINPDDFGIQMSSYDEESYNWTLILILNVDFNIGNQVNYALRQDKHYSVGHKLCFTFGLNPDSTLANPHPQYRAFYILKELMFQNPYYRAEIMRQLGIAE